MYAKLLEKLPISKLDFSEEDVSREECVQLTTAACMLMSVNSSLSPEDAVGDVLQVYQCVYSELRKLRSRAAD